MAIYTQLSPTATPGKPYSFVAKTGAGEHTGLFTELSVLGTPGKIHNFLAKDPVSGGIHIGLFTELSALGTPGKIHSFIAKTPYVPPVIPPVIPIYGGGGGGFYAGAEDWRKIEPKDNLRDRILKDDDEILELIATMLPFL